MKTFKEFLLEKKEDENEEEIEEGPFHLEVSVPLLIRLMEWCREEAKSDIEVHQAVEKMIGLYCPERHPVLDMDDYEELVRG